VQLDYDALLVLQIGDRAAGNDRRAGRDCRIVATEICGTGEIVDLTLGVDAGGAYVSGLEYDGKDRFYAGGGRSGRLRVIRRPAR